MIGKIIGAIAGSQASKHVRGLNGTGGALLGAAAPIVLRRLSPLTLVAAVAGAYAAEKHADSQKVEKLPRPRPGGSVEPTSTQA